uniref:Zinc knuckle CX2CX4HX4C domain-containing protein n=1 Tax=Nelumbo nucifera TaxID=4432 RepID=A0A822XG62_NELNU|nr:TPA_asm: hypothetical protein HUJ06_019452 [Nelumbo nucifera]
MRVELDLRRPIFQGFFLKNSDNLIWIRFAYEGLTTVYFYCGLVGYQWKKCRQLPPRVPHEEIINELENRSFEAPGEWLKAEYKSEKPFKLPVYRTTPTAFRQNQLIWQDVSSDEDSEDDLAEKRPRLLEESELAVHRQGKPLTVEKTRVFQGR